MPTQDAQTDVLPAGHPHAGSRSISLEFHDSVPTPVRSRMDYAFRVFAAIHGYSIPNRNAAAAEFRVLYGMPSRQTRIQGVACIPALYRCNSADRKSLAESAPSRTEFAGESFPLFLGADPVTGRPDWLGEIFLWLSGELEMRSKRRDAVGRIPFSETPFGMHGLSPRRPHAALLMAWLENALCGDVPSLPKAPSPVAGCEHIVLPSHDIDFHFSGRRSALIRLAKNLAIATRTYKNSGFFLDNLRKIPALLAGARPGDYLLPLLDAVQASGFQSTLFPVVRRAHRRDPNYSLETIAPSVAKALAGRLSLGLHGSYQSAMEERSLASEAAILGERFGKRPRANRQHWLRFESQRALFRQVESAGMFADSSLGFPESVGFRNGANFAFPPYDFERECPHRFLEIPLVVMDGGLEAEARRSGHPPQQIADDVLTESRNAGWGGVSILWHNPLEPLSVPREINDVFWRCAAKRTDSREAWLTFDQFLATALPRYQQAGLLEGISVNA